MNIQEIREQYPQYDDISDEELAGKLHSKYYSDIDFGEFSQKIGIESSSQPQQTTQQPEAEVGVNEEGGNLYEDPMEFVKGAFKVGSTEGLAFLSGAARAGLVDPFMAYAIEGEEPAGSFVSRFTDAFSANKATLAQAQQDAGLSPVDEQRLLEADPSGGLLLSGVKAVGDPFSYLGAPFKTAGVLTTLGTRAGGSFFAGAASDQGAKIGSELERTFYDQDSGTGALLGGLAAGTASSPTATATQWAGGKSADLARRTYEKLRQAKNDGGIPKENLDSIAAKGTENFLRSVTESEGIENIENIVKTFDDISSFVDSDQVPTFISMSNNPVVRQRTLELANSSPEVRKKLQDEIDTITRQVNAKADEIFGVRFSEIDNPRVSGRVEAEAKLAEERLAKADAKMLDLSNRLKEGTSRSPRTKDERIGRAIKNLVESKKRSARKAVGPDYNALFNSARENNITMKGRGTREIYEFIKQNNLRDIFGKGTAIDKDIKNYFAPEIKGRGIREYKNVPFDTVDSLKREINRLKRGKLSDTEERKLVQLESVVDSARDKYIPAEYNNALREIDAKYYQKVGMPFTEQGVLDIDAKKYAEQVAPVIVNKPSAMRQFLEAVPDKRGSTVARNAVLSDMASKVRNPETGVIDQRKMNSYIQSKSDVIDSVPGLRREVDSIQRSNGDLLYLQQDALNSKKKIDDSIAKNELLNIDSEVPNYNAMTKKLFSGADRSYLRNTLNKVNQLDGETKEAVLNNIRRETIEVARDSKNGAFDFMTDPVNKDVLNRIMGPEYVKNIQDMSKVMSALDKADLRNVVQIDSSVQDKFQRATSIPLSSAFSKYYQQIRSRLQSTIELGSKAAAFQGKKAEDMAVLEEIMKPANAVKFRGIADKLKGKQSLTSKEAQEAYSILKSVVPAYFIIGGSTGAEVNRQENEPLEIEITY